MKTLYMLVGPKGSGKTFIGTLMEQELHIPFFRAENIWVENNLDPAIPEQRKKGAIIVDREIDLQFENKDQMSIETTASFDNFPTYLSNLKSKYHVKLIQIKVPLDICFERVRTRDQASHVPVSDKRLYEINTCSERVKFDFDLVIENTDKSEEELLTLLLSL